MKKFLALLLLLTLVFVGFACGEDKKEDDKQQNDNQQEVYDVGLRKMRL